MRRALAIAVVAACRSKDTCEQVVDKVRPLVEAEDGKAMTGDERDLAVARCRQKPDDPANPCVLAANGSAELVACRKYQRRPEAPDQLTRLLKRAQVYYSQTGKLIAGKAGPLPAGNCCDAPYGKCPVATQWAKDPIWSGYDFSIGEPNGYRYSYDSDGQTAHVTAVGDLDCDGKAATFTLDLHAEAGKIVGKIGEPPAGVY
jgi:hypothetical protein